MKVYALDTGFFQLYFSGDERALKIYMEVKSGRARGFTLETNLVELYYKTCQKLGEETAILRDRSIRSSPIEIGKIDEHIARLAGRIKCRINISLADSLLAAAAKRSHATIVTTDTDFQKVKGIKTIILKLHRESQS